MEAIRDDQLYSALEIGIILLAAIKCHARKNLVYSEFEEEPILDGVEVESFTDLPLAVCCEKPLEEFDAALVGLWICKRSLDLSLYTLGMQRWHR